MYAPQVEAETQELEMRTLRERERERESNRERESARARARARERERERETAVQLVGCKETSLTPPLSHTPCSNVSCARSADMSFSMSATCTRCM